MKMLRLLLLLSLLVMLPSLPVAWGENWTYATSADTEDVYVDRESITRNGAEVKFWSKHVFKGGYSPTPGEAYQKVFNLIDCDNKTLALLTLVAYDSGDRTLYYNNFDSPKPIRFPPGSMFAGLARNVCGR